MRPSQRPALADWKNPISSLYSGRYWFAHSECADGSFYYKPNRDNAGYGSDSRISASAVTAFVFSIPLGNLIVTGRHSSVGAGRAGGPRSRFWPRYNPNRWAPIAVRATVRRWRSSSGPLP